MKGQRSQRAFLDPNRADQAMERRFYGAAADDEAGDSPLGSGGRHTKAALKARRAKARTKNKAARAARRKGR